ncbi:MAG: nitronate monooxygenase [Sphingobacteriales bacterium]|nr:MAG: nitronate monooxygenase [Sphingobacteriales bacterium]
MENRVSDLFGIKYPLIQAGMVWASGWRLAAAVSNAGGLGLLGAGSMYPDVLREQIRKCKAATDKPFGVNVPILYADIEKHIAIILEEKVPIVFTSAGNPKTWTPVLKDAGIKVVHVVSSSKFAREETTTMVLVPLVKAAVDIPVIAAGGIATGRQMLAAMVLGADGVQIGSRFVASEEASSHTLFKEAVVKAQEGDTHLMMKEVVPVRLLKNKFYEDVKAAEQRCASKEELIQLLGRGRAKKGMFEGNMVEGELEIGQVSASINKIMPAGEIVAEIFNEYLAAKAELKNL